MCNWYNSSWGDNIYGFNSTDKIYFKGEMEFLDKLTNDNTSNIGMISSASKQIWLIFQKSVYTFLLIIIGWMDSKVASEWKRENLYLNFNPVNELFTGLMMLNREELNFDG